MLLTFLGLLSSLEYEDHISYKDVKIKHSDIKDFPNMHTIHVEQSKETHYYDVSVFLLWSSRKGEKNRLILNLLISNVLANERQSAASVFFQL